MFIFYPDHFYIDRMTVLLLLLLGLLLLLLLLLIIIIIIIIITITFLMHTTPDIGHLLQPLEDIIRRKLIPSITGQSPPNDLVRDLLALPSRLGGIALANPIVISAAEFSSCQICGPLKLAILNCNFEYSEEISSEQLIAKKSVYKSKQAILSDIADSLKRPCLPLYGEQWTLLRKRSL